MEPHSPSFTAAYNNPVFISLDVAVNNSPLQKKIVEYAMFNPTFLGVVNDIADGNAELQSVFSNGFLLLSATSEFYYCRDDARKLFNNLHERIDEKVQKNNDWLFSLTLQESQLDKTSGIILNFITDVVFFIYKHENKNISFDDGKVNSMLKSVIKDMFIENVANMQSEVYKISALQISNFDTIIVLLNS